MHNGKVEAGNTSKRQWQRRSWTRHSHLEKGTIGNPIVTQQRPNPVCRNHEDFYPGSRKSSLLSLLASVPPCPQGGNHLCSSLPGCVLWEVLYCLLFSVARSEVDVGNILLSCGERAFTAGLPLEQVKEPEGVVFVEHL